MKDISLAGTKLASNPRVAAIVLNGCTCPDVRSEAVAVRRQGWLLMIDSMLRGRNRVGACEVCQKKPATRKARFTALFLQAEPTPLLIEERVSKMEFEKRVCEECAGRLQSMKNVTDLILENL